MVFDTFYSTDGLTGAPRAGTQLLCTNPITGTPDGEADGEANLGTLVPVDPQMTDARLVPGGVPAKCVGRGILSIGNSPPNLGGYVLPGNNYHVFDYILFWANIRADAERRLSAYTGK